jgi:hypothetical protein
MPMERSSSLLQSDSIILCTSPPDVLLVQPFWRLRLRRTSILTAGLRLAGSLEMRIGHRLSPLEAGARNVSRSGVSGIARLEPGGSASGSRGAVPVPAAAGRRGCSPSGHAPVPGSPGSGSPSRPEGSRLGVEAGELALQHLDRVFACVRTIFRRTPHLPARGRASRASAASARGAEYHAHHPDETKPGPPLLLLREGATGAPSSLPCCHCAPITPIFGKRCRTDRKLLTLN